MFRYKTRKSNIVMTALIILLCLICLTGATLALFTNDPNDGTIGIITTAGDVKVDIVDALATPEQSLVGGTLAFQTTSIQPTVYFEPGATFHTQGFKIKNEGSVPIHFRMYISPNEISEEDKAAGTLIERADLEELSKAFDIYITTDPANPDTTVKLTDFKSEEPLGVEKYSETYYLVVRMKEAAGNKYQGKTYTGVGVTVYAVQANAEIPE